MTLIPIFSVKSFSVAITFGSFDLYFDFDPLLRILIKFSVCLTESFFFIIFSAKKVAFSRPTKIFACPWVNLLFLINSIIFSGNDNNLIEFEICDLLLPINFETLS